MTGIFFEIGILIIIATILSYIAKVIKQPLIPAYVIAGVILGPILGIVGKSHAIMELSEIGVAFLLFVVGLELDFKKLKQVGKASFIGGTVQIALLFTVGLLIGFGLKLGSVNAIYMGMILAFSSTMVVVKILSDRNELDTLHGKIVIGFLLVEDFFAILALSIVNVIGDFNFLFVAIALLKTISLLALSYLINKLLFVPLFKKAAENQEILFLMSISSCFFFAFLFQYFGELVFMFATWIGIGVTVLGKSMITPGLSIAMGAFIAGIGLASLPFAYEIIAKVRSLRDFFATLFFVSLGLQLTNINLSTILIPLALLLGVVIFIKPVFTFIITAMFGYSKKTSFEASSSLAQTSEFSLILIASGLALNQIDSSMLSLAVILSVITIITTSYTMKFNNTIYSYLKPALSFVNKFTHYDKKLEYLPDKVKNEVLLVGFQKVGYNIFHTLRKLKKNFLVIDYNPEIIRKLISEKIHCIYGDIADEEIIERVNLNKARIIISTIPDIADTKFLVNQSRKHNKKAAIIVTAYNPSEALELYTIGADYVILPHFLGGNHASMLLEKFDKNFEHLFTEKTRHIKELNYHIKHNGHLGITKLKERRNPKKSKPKTYKKGNV